MTRVDRRQQDALIAVLARHAPYLRQLFNVTYVDAGFEIAGGQYTGKLALRVFVPKKQALDDLPKGAAAPESLDGVNVDVISSTPQLHAIARDSCYSSLLGGIETANRRFFSSGTLGMIVKDVDDDSLLALSNYHVWVDQFGQVGDEIVQPRATAASPVIGTLLRWTEGLDCAVATLNSERSCEPGRVLGIGNRVTQIAHPLLGTPVVKSGMMTDVTYGVIDGVGESTIDVTIAPDAANPSKLFQISLPGDSGAVWLDQSTGDAVALHYAGEKPGYPDRAWGKSFEEVAAALRFKL